MLCMCVHLLGIMVMALLLATSMMTSVAAMMATMVPQLLWFILFASTMLTTQPLLASIIKYIEDGHVVHIEVVITMPQTICVWIHVVAVVHP